MTYDIRIHIVGILLGNQINWLTYCNISQKNIRQQLWHMINIDLNFQQKVGLLTQTVNLGIRMILPNNQQLFFQHVLKVR